MNKSRKTILYAAIFVLLLAVSYFLYQSLSSRYVPENDLSQPSEENTETDEPSGNNSGESESKTQQIEAPDFFVYDIDNNAFYLSSFSGTPVVLNFWASWCPPCKSELPDFETLYQEYGDQVTFMMVNLTDGQRETVEIASEYIDSQDYSFPVYYDTQHEAAYTYGIVSIPLTLFIDKDGYIIGGKQGLIEEDALRAGIESILESDE